MASRAERWAPGRRVVFVGAVHEALPALRALLAAPVAEVVLVLTHSGMGSTAPSGSVDLAGPAQEAGVPVLATDDVNSPRTVAAVRAAAPDLIVVAGWTRLLRPPLLAVPRRGCVGFHASLLPRNRGRAPVNWAIIRGETETGNTMMMLSADVDTGDVVDQVRIPIGIEDTCATVYERVGRAGAQMLLRHLPALLAGTAPRAAQPRGAEQPLPKRTPEMGVVDWTRSAAALHDWVRALTLPYPGAFTNLRGHRIMVWRTRPTTGDPPLPDVAAPGTVRAVTDHEVRIATGDGELVVTELGEPGEPPVPAGPWCRRAGVGVGDRFDAVPAELSRWALGIGPLPSRVPA